MVKGPRGELILVVNVNNIVRMNGRNFWNEVVSYENRLYNCPNCPESSVCIYSFKQRKDHSQETHTDLKNVCEKCGLAYETKHECLMQKTKKVW